MTPREILLSLFQAAVDAAAPGLCLPAHLPPRPQGRTIVLGAGKAAAEMARVVEQRGEGPFEGLVIVPYGHGAPTTAIEVVEAGHPNPDEAGQAAARRILELAQAAGEGDLVLALISGGASSLLSLPPPAVPLADKQAVNRALLMSGAPIAEINCVRKHLSAIKGGRLALAAAPARVVSLIISDVVGDDPATIGSGPTAADPTTRGQAAAVLAAHGIDPPASVSAWLGDPASETPKPGDPAFARVRNRILATPADALAAAARRAEDLGLRVVNLGHEVVGEAREAAAAQAGAVGAFLQRGIRPPVVFLSGGETTVTVRGPGRGGRNSEFLLALALALEDSPAAHALAADTDGIDGAGPGAGAITAPDSLARARALGLDPAAALSANDAGAFFESLGDVVTTGPTRTNVNDFRAILVPGD